MGLLGGSKEFNPDRERCKLDEEKMEFQCEFEDQDGDEKRQGAIVVNVDGDGEVVGSEHDLSGFSQEEKQKLMQITGSQLEQEIDNGPLSGYSDGGL